VDPVDVEVFHHQLQSVAEEMGVALMRAAFSPNIKERRDHSCAIFDASGRLLAQAAHIPVHLGSMPMSVRAAIAEVPLEADQAAVLNDPFAGGTHLPDITLVSPVFAPGRRRPVFYVANRAHHADVGGATPGSLPISRHIDEEGFRIGPSLLTPALVDQLCRSSRTPAERRGDLAAQTAANRLGVQRVGELIERLGTDGLSERGRGLVDYSARLMETVIESIPDGEYSASDLMDGDGIGRHDVRVAVTITVRGRRCRVDFSDTGGQVEGPINAVRAITASAVFYVMRCLGPPEMPTNAGCLEPVELITRPGSLVDARPPAPVAAGNVETSQRIVDVLLRAFAQALPERIPAASAGSMTNITIGTIGTLETSDSSDAPDRSPTDDDFVYYETVAGGAGAGQGWHGASGVHTHMTNTLNTPVEALEHAYPLRLVAYHLRRDSGGLGRFRGGDGVVREYAFTVPARVTVLAERHRHRPYGLAGGEPGQPGRLALIEPDGGIVVLPGKRTIDCRPGQRLRVETPGGGGWGAPGEEG
jgi:N-methylhydantoinase B